MNDTTAASRNKSLSWHLHKFAGIEEEGRDGPLLGPDNGGCPKIEKQTMYIYIYIGESD